MNTKIQIKAFEAKLVDVVAVKIVEAAKKYDVAFSGPIPLPTRREIFTILRSVHVNKKSREQFEMNTHKRLIMLKDVNSKTLEHFKKLELPSGVELNIVTN